MSSALEKFQHMAKSAQHQCDKFKAEFEKDPAYALQWGNQVFQNAARLKIANMMIYAFTQREGEQVCSIADARELVMDRILHKARWPAQSTSPTSNLMEQYEAAAYAEALDELKHCKE